MLKYEDAISVIIPDETLDSNFLHLATINAHS